MKRGSHERALLIGLALLVGGAAACEGEVANLDPPGDPGEQVFALAQRCGPSNSRQKTPLDSIGRPRAHLSVDGPVARGILTNTGRRALPEREVNGPPGGRNQAWLSGCTGRFCLLYWQPPGGYGAYANVSRSKVRVYNGSRYIPARKCRDRAGRLTVRRLGGPPVDGRTVRRYLVATPRLDRIWHPTNGSTTCERGCAPLGGYACTHKVGGACRNVSGADAPPNTPQGGKGYAAGIYIANARRNKVFHKLVGARYEVRVPSFRDTDHAMGFSEWVYGYVKSGGGKVFLWVVRRAVIGDEQYWGYVVDRPLPGAVLFDGDDDALPEPDEALPGGDVDPAAASAVLAAPTGFAGGPLSWSTVRLSWSVAAAPGAVGYVLQRDGVEVLRRDAAQGTSFVDDVSAASGGNDTFTYALHTHDAQGTLSAPAAITVRTPPGPTLAADWHRFFSADRVDHYYTLNRQDAGLEAYAYEGSAARIFATQLCDTYPVYRYWHGGTRDNFYTTDYEELGAGRDGWTFLGVGGYLFAKAWGGTTPIYRYYNGRDHFYSQTHAPNGVFDYWLEGVLGHAY